METVQSLASYPPWFKKSKYIFIAVLQINANILGSNIVLIEHTILTCPVVLLIMQVLKYTIPPGFNVVPDYNTIDIISWQYGCTRYMLVSHRNIDGLVQDCSISRASAMEILQSCTNPSIYCSYIFKTAILVIFVKAVYHLAWTIHGYWIHSQATIMKCWPCR